MPNGEAANKKVNFPVNFSHAEKAQNTMQLGLTQM